MLSRITESNPVALVKRLRDWINDTLLPELQSRRLTAGHGISISRHPSGTVISATAETGGGAPVAPAQYFAVSVRNDSAGTIPAYHAVKLGDPLDDPPGWKVSPAVNSRAPWGITTCAIAPGCWGRAVLQGLALAAPATDGEGNFPRIALGEKMLPATDGMVAGTVGASVLAPPAANRPAVVILEPWQMPYTGYFAVRCVSWRPLKFKVENGSNPNSDLCGSTDFSDVSTVHAAEVTVPAGWLWGDVWLVISYTRNAYGVPSYSADIRVTGDMPTGDLFAFHLARIYPNGRVEQTAYDGRISMPGWVL